MPHRNKNSKQNNPAIGNILYPNIGKKKINEDILKMKHDINVRSILNDC